MIVDDNNVSHIRACIRQRRKALGVGVQYRASQQLAKELLRHSMYQQSQNVACYWAIGGELSCRETIKQLWRLGKRCYLPVIDFSTD